MEIGFYGKLLFCPKTGFRSSCSPLRKSPRFFPYPVEILPEIRAFCVFLIVSTKRFVPHLLMVGYTSIHSGQLHDFYSLGINTKSSSLFPAEFSCLFFYTC